MCPVYDYECENCKVNHTEIKKISERNDEEVCIICGNVCQRQIGSPPFILKGPGWARDGYAKRKDFK